MSDALIQFLAQVPAPRPFSITEQFPWLRDMVALFLGLGLIGLMIYLARPRHGVTGFTIRVDSDDITFKGAFPPGMQQMVVDFLRDDCPIEGAYTISGHWEERMLIIAVRGEQARPMEQRIRNFLKLNLKPPSRGSDG